MVSAAYATKLMADLGAEVIKVEEPGSAPPQYPPSFVARWQRPGTEGARLAWTFAWASGTLALSL